MGMRRNATACTKAKHNNAAAAWVEVRKSKKTNLRPYKCESCGKWHVGHSQDNFFHQSEMDRILNLDNAKRSLSDMKEWLFRQPIEVVMLMHDYCHGLMTDKAGNVTPSDALLKKRERKAADAMASRTPPQ